MGKLIGVAALALWVAVPVFAEGPCATKRVDACGCHHVHGIRHCHPNRKTDKCEATASAKRPLIQELHDAKPL